MGLPLLKSSLSILGKSSWIKLIVWIISRATAVGMACSCFPPNISHAAIQRTGLIRFPPAMREYPMDSQILSVSGIVDFTDASRAFSISSFLERRYSLRSKSVEISSSATVARLVVKAYLEKEGAVNAWTQLADAKRYNALCVTETILICESKNWNSSIIRRKNGIVASTQHNKQMDEEERIFLCCCCGWVKKAGRNTSYLLSHNPS